jgi:hypothetical protein
METQEQPNAAARAPIGPKRRQPSLFFPFFVASPKASVFAKTHIN